MEKQIFISHSSQDGETASEMCRFLEKSGKSCFIAPRDISFGKEYAGEIINGIDNAKIMILILSKASNESPHVLREVERAVSKSLPIIIYRLEEVELSKSLEYFLMTNQWLDAKKMSDYHNILTCVEQVLDSGTERASHQADTGEGRGESVDQSSKRRSKKSIYTFAAVLALCAALIICVVVKISSDTDKQGSTPASKVQEAFKGIQVGDTITFGRYQGEDIEWRVLKISDDKKEAVLVSKYILCMKAFDTAEGGSYNKDEQGNSYWGADTEADTDMELQIKVRGNSDWSTSNIRTWLNSADEVVLYQDQKPIISAMSEHKNGYNTEEGFLYGFTEEERALIVTTKNETKANALSDKDTITTEDKVYLLSLDELKWFEEAGINQLAEPTDKAFELDESDWFIATSETYGVKEYYWWLRDAVEGYASKCYIVGNGYLENNIFERYVGLEGYGIRPAVTVSLA